ncbi:MAG TPA: hypothetical protein VET25_02285 [Aestuariivirgaceae bacterium]|nr:hypothetical protein [Aestuariivirgaceae bacterium]
MIHLAVEIKNLRGRDLIVWFEPWAGKALLRSGALLTVECDSVEAVPLPIEYLDEAIAVYGVPGSSMKAFIEGQLVFESFERLPTVPKPNL